MGEHSAKRKKGRKTKPPEMRGQLVPLSLRERGYG